MKFTNKYNCLWKPAIRQTLIWSICSSLSFLKYRQKDGSSGFFSPVPLFPAMFEYSEASITKNQHSKQIEKNVGASRTIVVLCPEEWGLILHLVPQRYI